MFYTPNKNPDEAFMLISFIVLIGVIGGYFINPWVMAGALIFWIQYTAILSYLQFKRKSKHGSDTITDTLLIPQVRFFLFEVIAFIGLYYLIIYDSLMWGAFTLLVWWVFALNFYWHYKKK